eukprot:c11002_g1_i1.p1 GENE.c11002_g1_i1~~c11002_g1_i1.p1  ORF type:complete len:209 (+),score=88.20 c11002_g1_i1:63-689(+)
MFVRSALSLTRQSRFTLTHQRCVSSEVFQKISAAEVRARERILAVANVPAPTTAQIEAHERLLEAMKVAADRPAKTRMVGVMDAAIAADNLDYAFLAIQEINKRGFQQDPVTLKRLISACVASGEVDRAYQLVDSFVNFGCLADSECLEYLVNGYLSIGEPLKAYKVFSAWDNVDDAQTPKEPMVKSLVEALKAAGFNEQAKKAAAKL